MQQSQRRNKVSKDQAEQYNQVIKQSICQIIEVPEQQIEQYSNQEVIASHNKLDDEQKWLLWNMVDTACDREPGWARKRYHNVFIKYLYPGSLTIQLKEQLLALIEERLAEETEKCDIIREALHTLQTYNIFLKIIQSYVDQQIQRITSHKEGRVVKREAKQNIRVQQKSVEYIKIQKIDETPLSQEVFSQIQDYNKQNKIEKQSLRDKIYSTDSGNTMDQQNQYEDENYIPISDYETLYMLQQVYERELNMDL